MTENSDPNGSITDEELEIIKELYGEDLHYAANNLAPKWWIEDPYYGDVD